MKKKIKLFLYGVAVVVFVGLIAYDQIMTRERERQETYQKAVEAFEQGNYEDTYSLLDDLPKGYENRDIIYQELNMYNETYLSALSLLVDEDYQNALEQLNKLPDGYKDKKLLVDNMSKIEKLVENTWYDDPKDYNWYYETTFSLSDYSNDLKLYIFEDEYSGNTFMNTYTDSIRLTDLLDDGRAYVESDERDSFHLDINGVESGTYKTSTAYVRSTYKIKED